jgi:hypothetical protein
VRLQSSVSIRRPREQVLDFLGNIANISAWDRGVARAETAQHTTPRVGFEFATFAHPGARDERGEWGKMSYRITEIDPVRGCTVELTSRTGNARYFRSGEWRFRVEVAPEGSRVFCESHFKLRARYLFLAPVFFLLRGAIRNDLEKLKRALEDGCN